MSIDPYHAVQQDVQATLQAASTLRSSYLRIRNMAKEGSEELVWARNELKATLAALEADLEALEESVEVVESTGPRLFNLGDAEVMERRKYVSRVRKEIEVMRGEVEHPSYSTHGNPPHGQKPTLDNSRSPLPSNTRLREDVGEESQWEREAQQLLIQEQDRAMDSISGTLTTLAQQAGLMGREIDHHVE
ncbi:syntaxin 6, N-terminal-domain-containing protein [Scleroderma citrinum]